MRRRLSSTSPRRAALRSAGLRARQPLAGDAGIAPRAFSWIALPMCQRYNAVCISHENAATAAFMRRGEGNAFLDDSYTPPPGARRHLDPGSGVRAPQARVRYTLLPAAGSGGAGPLQAGKGLRRGG